MKHSYNLCPVVPVSDDSALCLRGFQEILRALKAALKGRNHAVIVVEIYPGIPSGRLFTELKRGLQPALSLRSEDTFLSSGQLRSVFAEIFNGDPVFSRMRERTIEPYFDTAKLQAARDAIAGCDGLVLVAGTGASAIADEADLLLSVNLGRWQIQQLQRAHRFGNLGFDNAGETAAELYKIGYFLDWRVGDHLRHMMYAKADFFLDATDEENPQMLAGDDLRAAVHSTTRRPFRVVPFFDPGPWGGQWMRRQFHLPSGPPNYAWGFDCVPEENSVLLGFGDRCFQLPAVVLVHEEPEALLGKAVHARFGAEFPIRFDFLDTVQGGNLSLQVHPAETYMRDHFGMAYTQDESYYILHSEPGASMFLGLKEANEQAAMGAALAAADRGETPFDADSFIARWPTARHDHFAIPAGTVHCAGEGNVVLEISATPYIFTFKLWDWGRAGLDGRPRPIHLEHGLANIRWERTAEWVQRELIGQTIAVDQGPGWREERTGLHHTQFLETRRHWFTAPVPHHTGGNLNVLNLVQGSAVLVSSPHATFPPLQVNFAETWIVPATAGAYTVAPAGPVTEPLATLKAYVRSQGQVTPG